MCQDFEMSDEALCDLEFLIAKLVGDISEEQVNILTELKDTKSSDIEDSN